MHSWRTHLLKHEGRTFSERLSLLLSEENEIRPTTTFTYYGLDARQQVIPVAVATVADRISSRFPYDGFPVIARAYIAREFRGIGLYPFLVRHRLDHCVRVGPKIAGGAPGICRANGVANGYSRFSIFRSLSPHWERDTPGRRERS